MPELPEVQTTVNGINEYAKNLSIKDVWTGYNSAFHKGKENIHDPAYFAFFKKEIIGEKIKYSSRRGKNILIHLSSDKTVLIHMKMTGHIMYGKYKKFEDKNTKEITWKPADPKDKGLNDPFNRFIRLVFTLSNGKHLVMSDTRKFAKVLLIKEKDPNKSKHLANHGPEPLDKTFTLKEMLSAVMKKPSGKIKIILMDHSIISGIGNIYSDEILWLAGVHPEEKTGNVPVNKWPIIFKATKDLLNKGIDLGGDSMSDYRNILGLPGKFQTKHKAYQRTDERCSKTGCKGKISRIKMGGRSAHFCDTHQKLINKK